MGYSKTILKLRADKSRVDAGAEEKREAITVNTEVVQKAHNLENSSGTRGNNGGGVDAFRMKRNTKINKGIGDWKWITIKSQRKRRGGGGMVNDGALGRIPSITKGDRVTFT